MNSMGKRRFNGLKLKILKTIAEAETRRIGIAKPCEVHWINYAPKNVKLNWAAWVNVDDDGKVIHIVGSEVRTYCEFQRIMRHELFHNKHIKLMKRVAQVPNPLRFLLKLLLLELPAYAVTRTTTNVGNAICNRCPYQYNKHMKEAKK